MQSDNKDQNHGRNNLHPVCNVGIFQYLLRKYDNKKSKY